MSRQSTAYHEAGHAVIARVLTLPSGRATIELRRAKDGFFLGHSTFSSLYGCLHEWDRHGRLGKSDTVWHALIMTLMAGTEAEAELLGQTSSGDDEDRRLIEGMVVDLLYSPPWERLEPRLRAMTRMLIRRHRASVERVAKALLAKTTLSAKRLDKLVGRSVDDVKVNAPYLLAMHHLRERAS